MAEKKFGSGDDKKEMGLGLIFLLLLVAVFIIWILTGGPNKEEKEKSIIEKPVWPAEVPSYGINENN